MNSRAPSRSLWMWGCVLMVAGVGQGQTSCGSGTVHDFCEGAQCADAGGLDAAADAVTASDAQTADVQTADVQTADVQTTDGAAQIDASPGPCPQDTHVQGGVCVACPAGSTNAAGDDPAAGDTLCDDFCGGGDVVLREPLTPGATPAGSVSGGSIGPEGWTTGSTSDQIFWDLGEVVASGSVTFEARGFYHNVGGCLWGVCYYVGLFEDATGDKLADYTGSAFIESRYHNDLQENFHDTFKLQAGVGNGSISEPMMPQYIGWGATEWHTFRIEWGGGQSHFYIDGNHQLTAPYASAPPVSWRYLFLGSTNYKGMGWAATGITYRNLCLRRM